MQIKIQKRYISLMFLMVVLLTIGSFFDLKISNISFVGQYPNENIFGIIFSYIGVIPTFAGWSFLGTIILFLSKGETKRKKKILCRILAIFQYILSFFFLCNTIMFTNNNIYTVHWLIAYSIGIIIMLLSIYGGYVFAKKSTNKDLLNEVVFVSVISLITMVIIMSLKDVMARPRYIYVLETNDYKFFINWWENGHLLKSSVSASAISENFKSFPSGHSAYSMFAVFIFPLLSKLKKETPKLETILFLLGVIWWVVTAYSRITVGAHYLTDVSFSGLILLISYLITSLLFKKTYKKS